MYHILDFSKDEKKKTLYLHTRTCTALVPISISMHRRVLDCEFAEELIFMGLLLETCISVLKQPKTRLVHYIFNRPQRICFSKKKKSTKEYYH